MAIIDNTIIIISSIYNFLKFFKAFTTFTLLVYNYTPSLHLIPIFLIYLYHILVLCQKNGLLKVGHFLKKFLLFFTILHNWSLLKRANTLNKTLSSKHISLIFFLSLHYLYCLQCIQLPFLPYDHEFLSLLLEDRLFLPLCCCRLLGTCRVFQILIR